MAVIEVSGLPSDPLGVALGVQFEPAPVTTISAFIAPVSQRVFGVAVYATAGATITGIKMRNTVAAAGTSPTIARFGLADNTGKMLALSANVNAAANFPSGVIAVPLTAPFTLGYSGVYFPCYVVNGSWGTTQPTPGLIGSSSGGWDVADGTNPPPSFIWSGQTDLPAVGSSLTITGSGGRFYMALY